MKEIQKNTEVLVWIPLIGFDRDKEDKGVSEIIERMGFKPQGFSAFVSHPDIIHYHNGINELSIFPAIYCSHAGSQHNIERERQEWTNYDLKLWANNVVEAGVEAYLSVSGMYSSDYFHKEFVSLHPELHYFNRYGREDICFLKRFADGTYYEDFFIEKAVQAVCDYGFSGLHLADIIPQQSISEGDFSSDMIEQFFNYLNIEIPKEIKDQFGDDSQDIINQRGDIIWGEYRLKWIDFHVWRWEIFWRKLSSALHKMGKKVIANNAWCSEPFEAIYRYGIDYKLLVEAGIDSIISETMPNSELMIDPSGTWPYRYFQYMSMGLFVSAYTPKCNHFGLLGVKDAVEEWDVLRDGAPLIERDIYRMASYYTNTKKGLSHSINSRMVCLGDAIWKDQWETLNKHIVSAYSEVPEKVLAPTFIWSDSAVHNLLPDYVESRRWSTHKMYYELTKRGAVIGAVVRSENLSLVTGAIFAANFDLMDKDEQKAIIGYTKGPVICIASAKFKPEDAGIIPDIYIKDRYSNTANCAFVINMPIENKEQIHATNEGKDDSPEIDGTPFFAKDPTSFHEDLVFAKVSEGFFKACVELINLAGTDIVSADTQLLPMQMKDGRLRIHIFNDDRSRYGYVRIKTKKDIKTVKVVSSFPELEVKYCSHEGLSRYTIINTNHLWGPDNRPRAFITRVRPGGVSVFDIVFENNKGGKHDELL